MSRFWFCVYGIFLLCSGVTLSVTTYAQEMHFVVPEYLPYTGLIKGKADGIALPLIQKIFKQAGIKYTVQVVPNYSRCVLEVTHGHADGFFLGSQNAERDAVAVMTNPVTINNWIWVNLKQSQFSPDDQEFQDKARIGVLINTNPHTWLKDQRYTITGTPSDKKSLLKMLKANRFDAILVPELVYLVALKETSDDKTQYQTRLLKRTPFGIYISREYLKKYPQQLEKINAAILKTIPQTSMQTQLQQ